MLGMALVTDKKAEIGLNVFRDVLKAFKTSQTHSLIDATRPARVEPIVMVDAALVFNDDLPTIMQSLLSQFSGFYLQAVALSMNVGNISPLKTLDKLNPRRDPTDAFITAESDWMLAQESYQYGLPQYSAKRQQLSQHDDYLIMPVRLSMESNEPPPISRGPSVSVTHHDDDDARRNASYEQRERHHDDQMRQREIDRLQRDEHLARNTSIRQQERADKIAEAQRRDALERDKLKQQDRHHYDRQESNKDADKGGATSATVKAETIRTVNELSNLSVGKLLSVEVSDGQASQSVLVSVRLIASTLPTDVLVHALSDSQKDISFKARWHGWRSGRLEFWKDLIWCQDLIDAHRQHLMKDKDGLFRSILGIQRKNSLASLLSGRLSVATASNIAVISEETAQRIEYEGKVSLSNYKQRQKLFDPTALMILVVVSNNGYVKFYYRGIPEASDFSMRDLKVSNKGAGPDIAEMMKLLMAGSPPRI